MIHIFFLSVGSSSLTDYYTLYPGSYLENEGNHRIKYIYKKDTFQEKGAFTLF